MTNFNWYVVYTKPKFELKVASLLARRNVKNYCPLHIVDNQLSDSKRVLLEPLFTSFVFVYIQEAELDTLLGTPGIVNFLYWLDKPVTVREEEINSLVKLSKQYSNLKLEKYLINNGNLRQQVEAVDENLPEETPEEAMKVVLPSIGYSVIATAPVT